MMIILVLIGYALLLLWIVLQTRIYLQGAGADRPLRMGILCAVVLLSIMPILGTFLPIGAAKHFFMKWGNQWIGLAGIYAAYLLVALIIRSILLRSKAKRKTAVAIETAHSAAEKPVSGKPGLSKRACIAFLCIGLAVTVLLNVYGAFHATDIKVVRHEATVGDTGRKVRIVLAADLHMSVNSSPDTIRQMVEKINEQEPDLVVFAGDFFTSTYDGIEDPQAFIDELKKIRAKEGVFGVYGNHDVAEDLFCGFPVSPASEAFRDERMVQFLEDSGITMLEDEAVVLPSGIQLAGRLDEEKPLKEAKSRKKAQELLRDCDPSELIIVAEHEPGDYKALTEAGADIILSGHTHNGQVFPGNLVTRILKQKKFENISGHKEHEEKSHSFVTSGAGFFGPPLRLGTDSDIYVIDVSY